MTLVYIGMALALLVALFLGIRAIMYRRNRTRYFVTEHPGFLTAEECDHVIELARPLIKKSRVVRAGESKSASALRTSGSAFLENAADRTTRNIKRRIAELSETDIRCQESLQVTHYFETEFYVPHRDALGSESVDVGDAGDRYCTVIIYLNDDYTGGATRFHKVATRITPERGKAVLFYNLTDDQQKAHPLSLHGAEPVLTGEKWIANQWIRLRPTSSEKNRRARRGKGKNRGH